MSFVLPFSYIRDVRSVMSMMLARPLLVFLFLLLHVILICMVMGILHVFVLLTLVCTYCYCRIFHLVSRYYDRICCVF